MQRIAVSFESESIELEVPEGRCLATWNGPPALDRSETEAAIRQAIETPLGYPGLRQIVVPGDRVAVACDLDCPEVLEVLQHVVEVLRKAEVGQISVVCPKAPQTPPTGIDEVIVHQRAVREQLAYLASTTLGERIYLNRTLTDADCVVVVSRLGFDDTGRERGPWSLIYPTLADEEALKRDRLPKAEGQAPEQDTSEVAWLLGNPFQVAVLPGVGGIRAVFAGANDEVRLASSQALADDWTFRVEEQADLVVCGIGNGDGTTSWADLTPALASATKLVQRGGRVVVLSRLKGSIGPALSRLMNARDPRAASLALRGKETEPDWPIAHRLVESQRWADLFLLSNLDNETAESLGFCPIENTSQVARLAAESHTCIIMSQGSQTRVRLADEPETIATPVARKIEDE